MQNFQRRLNSILASDHAHTVDEKESSTPPSGMPGVETMSTFNVAKFLKVVSI